RKLAEVLGKDGFIIDQLTINGALRLPENAAQAINRAMEATQNAIQAENRVRQVRPRPTRPSRKRTAPPKPRGSGPRARRTPFSFARGPTRGRTRSSAFRLREACSSTGPSSGGTASSP